MRAAELALALDVGRVEALEALRVDVAGIAVELRLLGHSHQVCAGELIETVACRPGVRGELPHAHADGRYTFTASVGALDAHAGRALVQRVAADAHGLVGVFAGDAAAFTALCAHEIDGGVRWETWHAYPQTRELVATTGTLVLT